MFEQFAPRATGVLQITWWFNEQPEPAALAPPSSELLPSDPQEVIHVFITSPLVTPAHLDAFRVDFANSDPHRMVSLEVHEGVAEGASIKDLIKTHGIDKSIVVLDERTAQDNSVLFFMDDAQLGEESTVRSNAKSVKCVWDNLSIANMDMTDYREWAQDMPNGILDAADETQAEEQDVKLQQIIVRRADCDFEPSGRWKVTDSAAERLGIAKGIWFQERAGDLWLDSSTEELGMSARRWS